jgi:integrase/recombinase XerD
MPDIVPIEQILVPTRFSGESGRNRGIGHSQLDAKDDISAVLAWLALYSDSPSTLASYRKESERLLLWCITQRGRALSDLSHEDLLVYQEFLRNPQPADKWIMAPGYKAARNTPGWRPFAGPLALSSRRQAVSILNCMFNWLVQAGYLAGNPLALRRRVKPSARKKPLQRFLPEAHWAEVRGAIDAMPIETPRERAHATRARWLFALLYIGSVRISEVCSARMGNFHILMGSDGKQRWWLDVTGKGGKARSIPVTDELLIELQTYRISLGLKPLPSPGDATPAIVPLIGVPTQMVRQAVYEIVKEIVRAAAARMRAMGPEHEAAATHIESSSPHWMRHTAASHLGSKVDVITLRDNMGHESIATSNIYMHTEDEKRHDKTNAAHRLDWTNPQRTSSGS